MTKTKQFYLLTYSFYAVIRIVKQKSVKELNVQLESLVGTNSNELLVGALRSRKSISSPELTK
jgi:hypothetical protein